MRKDTLLSIGKMAALNHVTIPTLRLYDQLGLLKPRYTDPDSGYRYYDICQTSRLEMIMYMRDLDMSLAEISDILQKEDLTLIEHTLIQKNEALYQEIREIRARQEAVQRAIQSIERYRKSPVKGTISLEYIDQRYVWYIPCSENFYELGIESYEKTIQELRQVLIDKQLPQLLSYNLGTSIQKEDYLNHRYLADQVFIFGDKHLKQYGGDVRVIDSGMFACIYLDDFDYEIEYANQLLDYCKAHHYTISGDYICEEMTEFNVFDHHQRNMFLRLQVPVSFEK